MRPLSRMSSFLFATCTSNRILINVLLLAVCTNNTFIQAFAPMNVNSFLKRRVESNLVQSNLQATVTAPSALASVSNAAVLGIDTYWLTRVVFLRALGFVSATAFLIAYFQNKALIGDTGIVPARKKLNDAERDGAVKRERRKKWAEKYQKSSHFRVKFLDGIYEWWTNRDRSGRPLVTLLWFAKNRSQLNSWLDGIALLGLVLALTLLLLGAGNVPLILGLWICQHSLMSVGSPFYSYGWEPQLAELLFHTLFMVPLISLKQFPIYTPVPKVVIWAIRWHLFRIMIGAGLIKFRSKDIKWRDLTAMNYFYETQPVPSLLTKNFHRMPEPWHKFEVLSNHFVELIAPWALILPFIPREVRIWGALTQILFQATLICTGNLSFLNWLTIIPSIICLDDAFFMKLFSPLSRASAAMAAHNQLTALPFSMGSTLRLLTTLFFGLSITKLSLPVVQNLCSKNQIMNGSFDPLRLINTYGAFGTVSEDRIELVVSSAIDPNGPWKEYNFKVKPGDVRRNPRWISPYHYRIDWQFWIAQFSYSPPPWMYSFLLKILKEDRHILGLLESNYGNPWSEATGSVCNANNYKEATTGLQVGKGKPKYIRVDKYKYKFAKPGTKDNNGEEVYWERKKIGKYFPKEGLVTEDDLDEIVKRLGIL